MTDLSAIYRDKSPSTGTKATLACLHLGIVVWTLWLLLGGGISVLDGLLGRPHQLAGGPRRVILAAAAVLYFLRTLATVFVFLRRRMPWREVFTIAPWIATFDTLLAYLGGRNPAPVGGWALAGVALLLLGSALNTGSELQRHRWKLMPAHAGHLYTGGLWSLARHVNYFGDELLFIGWTMVAGRVVLATIPAAMAAGFLFVNIPALDRYLAERYGEEFQAWRRSVKSFIPYVVSLVFLLGAGSR